MSEGERRPYTVLFLCTGNSARSIIAEAILNRIGKRRFRAYSAGSHPSGTVNPNVIALLTWLGFDIAGARSKSWNEFSGPDAPALDFVITVCDAVAGEVCPVWPGQPLTAHWGVPNPTTVQGTLEEITRAFRKTFDLLERRIALFADSPVENQDRLALSQRMDEIGKVDEPGAPARARPAVYRHRGEEQRGPDGMPLFEATRHEPLGDASWDEARAAPALARIVADTERTFETLGHWPVHPLDRTPERPADTMKPLYFGAAGVIWALTRLKEVGAVSSNRDYAPAIQDLVRRHHVDLTQNGVLAEYLASAVNAFQMGETGMRFVEWKLAPSQPLADRIYRALETTIGDPRGIVWGSAGSMLAILALFANTQEGRWADLYLRMFESLWAQMRFDGDAGVWTWTHDLYGVRARRVGALHGFAANALAMLRGRHLLASAIENELLERVSQTIMTLALTGDGLANWPVSVETKGPPFVQFCSGAPGIIIALSKFPQGASAEIDRLLIGAGELVWAAGPLTKLPVLCHGTAGNGFAFLKLYERTGDGVWLTRARAYAMHAIAQNEAALQKHGQRKYSLWTGDLGLALYLQSCLEGSAAFPILDTL